LNLIFALLEFYLTMAEEQISNIKLPTLSCDDAKLKTLEARLVGPSKDGLPPIQSVENVNVETIKTSKSFFKIN
jgi:hypothetical protein